MEKRTGYRQNSRESVSVCMCVWDCSRVIVAITSVFTRLWCRKNTDWMQTCQPFRFTGILPLFGSYFKCTWLLSFTCRMFLVHLQLGAKGWKFQKCIRRTCWGSSQLPWRSWLLRVGASLPCLPTFRYLQHLDLSAFGASTPGFLSFVCRCWHVCGCAVHDVCLSVSESVRRTPQP